MNDEFQEPQGIKEETRRSIRRAILTPCGQQALEIVEEHHIVYARPRHSSPQSSDSVRTVLASIVSFLIVALTFTAAGGGDQSLAWAPVYWVAFLLLWSWLA